MRETFTAKCIENSDRESTHFPILWSPVTSEIIKQATTTMTSAAAVANQAAASTAAAAATVVEVFALDVDALDDNVKNSVDVLILFTTCVVLRSVSVVIIVLNCTIVSC